MMSESRLETAVTVMAYISSGWSLSRVTCSLGRVTSPECALPCRRVRNSYLPVRCADSDDPQPRPGRAARRAGPGPGLPAFRVPDSTASPARDSDPGSESAQGDSDPDPTQLEAHVAAEPGLSNHDPASHGVHPGPIRVRSQLVCTARTRIALSTPGRHSS
jgi:hypothetical protein